MKALSVKQPWSSLIGSGQKPVENRSWRTRYRGPLLICAGALPDKDAAAALAAQGLPQPLEAPLGVAICVVDLVDVMRDHSSPWAWPGQWHWILENARPVAPLAVKGQLGLFDVAVPPP